jgi:hypothetical protein
MSDEFKEPSVLDYILSRINPWAEKRIEIPDKKEETEIAEDDSQISSENDEIRDQNQATDEKETVSPVLLDQELKQEVIEPVKDGSKILKAGPSPKKLTLPWRGLLAFFLALIAQRFLEPPQPKPTLAIFIYILAGIALFWAIWKKDWVIIPHHDEPSYFQGIQTRFTPLVICLVFIGLAYLTFGSYLFGFVNILFWVLALVYAFWTFWAPGSKLKKFSLQAVFDFLKRPFLNFRITPWFILLVLCSGLILFFRFYRLNGVLGEMFSDHAEKLLDVSDVLSGKFSVFFPRNTGREAIQMYLTAAVSLIFGTGLSFMSLKIGTVLAGLFTLPYMYLLGKELGNKWVGLFAILLAGIAYWPNLISRIGLRFPLYPLFVAPTLYYLIRGIRYSNRNDFILSGLALGIGLHGYSPIRFLPFVVTAGVAIFLLHKQAKGKRKDVILAWAILAFIALVVFIPLLRYWGDNPDMFSYRALTRLGTSERQFPGAVWLIFLGNLWNAVIMFFWNNGNIWVHSVPNRPALDVVTAALFFLGMIIVLYRYIRHRNWIDLFLLVSVPLLMMPSILSLAFPEENPSLNRTGGAIIPVFIIAAIALEGLLSGLLSRVKSRWLTGGVVIFTMVILGFSINQNYDLVFRQFNDQFMAGAWNTSDMGHVIRGFADSIGSLDNAYVVPYPYWVDTRLVGINAGNPLKDYALWPEDFSKTLTVKGNKLFIIKPEDQASIDQLSTMYPNGVWEYYDDNLEGKDFWILMVPSESQKK